MSGSGPTVTRIDARTYRVETDGRQELVYVVVHQGGRLAWWNGRTFAIADDSAPRRRAAHASGAQLLTAPMPARVLKVNVTPGDPVRKGDTVVILEAMKMEWPIRATADGIVSTVSCQEGTLVTPDTPLLEISPS